jgi:hypothetical protein
MTTTFEAANEQLRKAIEKRREMQAAGRPSDEWYDSSQPTIDPRYFVANTEETQHVSRGPTAAEVIERFGSTTHPSSQAFYDLCDALKEMHRSKSNDYGCPTGTDPLANIRNGAAFVGIEPWRAAMVRLSDKVTRLATFNAKGTLTYEGVEDTLVDLASYALLSLVLYREEQQR